MAHAWRSDDNLWESVLSFLCVLRQDLSRSVAVLCVPGYLAGELADRSPIPASSLTSSA